MLWSAAGITGYTIEASDGGIGSIADFLFDDTDWIIRWAVVDTGNWLPGRKVLLPPARLERADPVARTLAVGLTKQQVEDGPDVASAPTVGRQEEMLVYNYYGWAPYWSVGGLATSGIGVPPIQPPAQELAAVGVPVQSGGDPHLRGAREVTGYDIRARDGDIGHVEDFLIDSVGWELRYLIVDTVNWWPGKKVLVAPHWAADISWSERTVSLEMTRDQIRNSPEYDPASPIDRNFEERLHSHYERPAYWF